MGYRSPYIYITSNTKHKIKFHMVLLLTPTIYSTINLLNTFDNGTITLRVTTKLSFV